MKISIVMAYYNRRKLLLNTLYSITKTQYKDNLEIVIVNDASDDSINDITTIFPLLDFKIINIKKNDKWWVNPCIPTNVGFYVASGDVIIIQNPECLHLGDIISTVEINIANNRYLVFGCYSIGHGKTNLIDRVDVNSASYFEDIINIISPTNDIKTSLCNKPDKWYQHSLFNTGAINFCTAIMKRDLDDLGGFDEKFAEGIAKDDRDFILRINRKGMDIKMIDTPLVIHQRHRPADYGNRKLVERNNKLFSETVISNSYKVDNKSTKKLIEELLL